MTDVDAQSLSRCWDGKNLDSPDHVSHVSYPASGTFENNGPCPSTHPVKLPQLMFEVIWDTTAFNDKSLWPADGSQPFVFSQGDRYDSRPPLGFSFPPALECFTLGRGEGEYGVNLRN